MSHFLECPETLQEPTNAINDSGDDVCPDIDNVPTSDDEVYFSVAWQKLGDKHAVRVAAGAGGYLGSGDTTLAMYSRAEEARYGGATVFSPTAMNGGDITAGETEYVLGEGFHLLTRLLLSVDGPEPRNFR